MRANSLWFASLTCAHRIWSMTEQLTRRMDLSRSLSLGVAGLFGIIGPVCVWADAHVTWDDIPNSRSGTGRNRKEAGIRGCFGQKE
jgi:hypothetical protein